MQTNRLRKQGANKLIEIQGANKLIEIRSGDEQDGLMTV
jgi:hypothetical protein